MSGQGCKFSKKADLSSKTKIFSNFLFRFGFLVSFYQFDLNKKSPESKNFELIRTNFEIGTTVFCYHKYYIERKDRILGVLFFFQNEHEKAFFSKRWSTFMSLFKKLSCYTLC